MSADGLDAAGSTPADTPDTAALERADHVPSIRQPAHPVWRSGPFYR